MLMRGLKHSNEDHEDPAAIDWKLDHGLTDESRQIDIQVWIEQRFT